MITFLLILIVLLLFWIGSIMLKFNNNFVKWTKFHYNAQEPWRRQMAERRNKNV